eukprot:SAG22_NODE_11_length_35583_cov_107.128790_7_plen_141_part_00
MLGCWAGFGWAGLGLACAQTGLGGRAIRLELPRRLAIILVVLRLAGKTDRLSLHARSTALGSPPQPQVDDWSRLRCSRSAPQGYANFAFFCCTDPPDAGGYTILSDARRVHTKLSGLIELPEAFNFVIARKALVRHCLPS